MISFENVSYKYRKNYVLREVSFKIFDNKLNLITGSNGSGKTTVLKIIIGALNIKKNNGIISNDYKKFSYLPEKFILPNLVTPFEFIDSFLGLTSSKCNIMRQLEQFNVENKLIIRLSKGNFQKIGIISCLNTDADLYLLDEPTDGLDKLAKKVFISLIKQLLLNNKTILIATHEKNSYRNIDYNEIKL